MNTDEVTGIIQAERNCSEFDLEQYVAGNNESFPDFETGEDVLDDFDRWKEQSDLAWEKFQDTQYYSSL
jgi:hypothetical protein